MATINSFEDLFAWQKAKQLTLLIYSMTKKFPTDERFGMIPQMRRASISVTSNIAEGFGRQQPKDKEHFYVMALGSLSELLSQLIIARELGYINQVQLAETKEVLIETRRLMLGLLKSHRG